MSLDQVANFIQVIVSGTHTSGTSTVSLQPGEASKLPNVSNGKYNLVWFDSQNFRSPDVDPNAEIVRVNSIDTTNDTINVTRGVEDTSTSAKNTSNATYELFLGLTAKTITDIDQQKLDENNRYTDSEARTAVDNSNISLNHDNLTGVSSSDHHSRYSDSEATSAVESSSFTDVAISNITDTSGTDRLSNGENETSLKDEHGNKVLNANSTNEVDLKSQNQHDISLKPGGEVNLNGNNISEIGGTNGASSGAIKLANNNSISWRNSNNSGDFSISYTDNNELVITGSDGVELIRQPESGKTQFLQGADIGPIEAPENSFTQLTNAVATSASTSGDTIGYTFAVNNQTIASINANSNGSGGITNKEFSIRGNLTDGTDIIYDQSTGEIPDSALGSISNSTLTNNTITVEGNNVPLGGSTSINHNDLTSISTNDHHSKTSSASELTDVSPDSTSDAHHTRYSDSEVVDAVESSSNTLNLSTEQIGMNNDEDVIVYQDQNNQSGEHWSNEDALEFRGDNNVSGIVARAGYLQATEAAEIEGPITTGNVNIGGSSITTNNFEVTENSSTESLDFNYTG